MLKIPIKKEKELVDFLKDRFNSIFEKKKLYDERVLDWIGDYCSIPKGDKEEWESDLFIPYSFSQVATIKPRLKASLFQYPDFINVKAKTPEYANDEFAIRDYLLSMLDEIRFVQKIKDAIHLTLPQGTSWIKVTLSPDKNKIKLSLINFFDIIVDFTQRGDRSNDFVDLFHRIETNISNLRVQEKRGVYKNVERVLKTQFPVDEIIEAQLTEQKYYLSIEDLAVDTKEYKNNFLNKVELLEYWGKFDINDDGIDENIVATLANREVLLRVDINEDGIIPIFPIRAYRIPKIVYGKSFMQMIEGLQYELNLKRNQFLDVLNLIVKPWFKARRSAEIDWDNLWGIPNNVIRMDDPMTDLIPFEMKAPPSYMFNTESLIKNDIQYTTGASDYAQGISSARGYNETATGISIITSEGATRFRDYIDDISYDMLDLIYYILHLIKKHANDYQKIRLYNSQEWLTITDKQLAGDYKIEINLTPLVTNKELRMQVLANLINMLGNRPDINIKPIIRNILDLAEIRDKDEIMGNERQQINKKELEQGKKEVRTMKSKEENVKENVGLDRPIQEILQNPAGIKPLNPSAPQIVRDPMMELIKNMGGKL